MRNPIINCTFYIASSGEKVWDALTNPDVTQKYWGNTRLESDWKVGSPLIFRNGDEITDENTILENKPKNRLSYTFEPTGAEFSSELASRVIFTISDNGDVVRLMLVHDGFAKDSVVFDACKVAWPMILSNLKSLLETNRVLPSFDFP